MASFDEAPPRNPKAGEKIFKTKCAQCHTVDKGTRNKHDSEQKTLKRFIQSTLFPPRFQENGEGQSTSKDKDDEYCGRQSNNIKKRKGNGNFKCTPPAKAPTNSQEALHGNEGDKKLQQKQRKDKKGADSPERRNKRCIDLESEPCKRSPRLLKRGRSDASPPKDPTPSKPKTTPKKFKATPSKLKGSHCKRLMRECKSKDVDLQSEHATETVFDLRLEAKMAAEYHTGYQEQMSHWPELPVNIIIKWLKDHSPSLVVADFGCGDARLAKNVKNKVYSIDLVSNDPSVIECDMSNTPLDSSSVDVAVFCLSLMGTNFPCFLQEAQRVLKPSGWLLIAEVKSRFDPNSGGADPNRFMKAVCELGFTSVSKDFSNKMFLLFFFKKRDKKASGKKEIEWPELKPCLYKRR